MSTTSQPVPIVVERDSAGWSETGPGLKLRPGEIHIWRQGISVTAEEVRSFWELLSADERSRAERYRFEASRRTFVICRGMLRSFLGCYLGEQPARLEFAYTQYGRPELVRSSEQNSVEFNLSHTADFALLAFSRDRRIGIDIERVRGDFDTSEIAERFFSECERSRLREIASAERHLAFFRCWTRKEAFIKALGEGLSHPLDTFDVSIERESPPRLLATRPDATDAEHWLLWDVTVPSGYVAALAGKV